MKTFAVGGTITFRVQIDAENEEQAAERVGNMDLTYRRELELSETDDNFELDEMDLEVEEILEA